jgi:hypothetical protein
MRTWINAKTEQSSGASGRFEDFVGTRNRPLSNERT